MSKLLSVVALVAFSSIASAAMTFTFFPATDGSYRCSNPSLCVGFVSSDPGYSVDSVNVATTLTGGKIVTIIVNGKAYSGSGNAVDNTVQGVVAQAADGSIAMVDVTYNTRRTCTVSGRAQHCTTYTHTVSGTVTL